MWLLIPFLVLACLTAVPSSSILMRSVILKVTGDNFCAQRLSLWTESP
jgi:hypothetical protein